MAFSLGGLASGMDTETLVSQLMAVERRPQTKITQTQKRVETHQQGLRDIMSRLQNLKSAAADLRSSSTWAQAQTVESSDAARVGVKRLSAAGAGAYQIEVSQLARAEQRTYSYVPQGVDSTLDIKGVTVNVLANATVDEAVTAINGTSGITVLATNVSGQIVMTAKASGTDAAFAAVGGSLTEDLAKERLARNALYEVDDVARTSQSNQVTDGVLGLELSLKGLTGVGTPVSVSVGAAGPDRTAVAAKVKAFVDQYNSTTDLMRTKTSEKKVVNPTNDLDRAKGVLRGDSTLTGLLAQMRVGAMSTVDGVSDTTLDSLAEIGVTTGATTGSSTFSADSVSGKLVFDEAKLMAALERDPGAVQQMLGGVSGQAGLAQRFEAMLEPALAVGGPIDTKITGDTARVSQLRTRFDELDRRLALKEEGMRSRFQAMERALAASQSQGSWLTSQLQSLQ